MSELITTNEDANNLTDFSILQSKMREKFYELGVKRKLLDEMRNASWQLDAEKHILNQKVERSERQLSDVNIHLQVAIKAAREAETERSTARELMARQGAQLEAASKEREYLQQANRTLQLEIDQNKRDLEDAKSKMLSQSNILELIRKKDVQNKAIMDTLQIEIGKFGTNQTELKELCSKITLITKIVNTVHKQQKVELAELRRKNMELQEKIISLNGQGKEVSGEPYRNISNDLQKNEVLFEEWKQNQGEMQAQLKSAEEENQQLQLSLNNALLTITRLQATEKQLAENVRQLEDEMRDLKLAQKQSMEVKETQTNFEISEETNLNAPQA